MIEATALAQIDEPKAEKWPGSGGVSWGHFGGMLMLMGGTAGFWLLVFRYTKRENRKRA